ncbi:lipopolysaccharide biosynthesis protein [Phreatobacter cathodiphilus]|uniref:Polysaccharide biosynthesis protein n=1 Tax=Phreatobacter cathodiphilus TaxID=1868589 RepID=A0A2S0N9Q6_9HYPH|nr:lipopolysaccharide biosynthesis protein [Phreatobacter cathodiphilus]AVO44836.1 polysaccharide biosynthesis protein [Phreatobacter cathodiphilus]
MLIRQTSTYMVAHGTSSALGFLSVILFTRMLTPAEYGVYVVALSVAGIVSALLFTWVRLSVLRFESEGEATDIRLTALAAYAVSAATLPIALGITVWALAVPLDKALAALVLAAALGLFELGQEILRARLDSTSYMRATVVRAFAAIGISFALVQAGWGGFGLVAGVAGAYVIAALAFSPAVWKGPRKPFDAVTFRTMLGFGIPMAMSGGVFALHAALDRLLVAALLGDAAAGVYGAAADLVRQIILFPALSVASAVVPLAIRALAEEGPAAADIHLTRSGELLLAVVMPAVVGLAIVAPHFAALILGPEFRDIAAVLIPILVFAWLFQTISQQFVQISFHLAKKPSLMVAHGTAILVANVVGMAVLVPAFGLKGAAWSLVLAEAVGVAAGYALSRRAHPLPFAWRPVIRVVAAVLVMAAPTVVIARAGATGDLAVFATAVVTGVVTYAAAALALDVAGVRSAMMHRIGWSSGRA